MAYKAVDDENFLEDINSRKEFRSFQKVIRKSDYQPHAIFDLNKAIMGHIRFTPYQNFASNLIHPNTPYSRLLLVWDTGTGKTLGAFAIAKNFIDFYAQAQMEVGSVFIIGFSKKVFQKELMIRPELGFVTREEVEQISRLKYLASGGSAADVRRLQDITTKIKKRFGDRKVKGYFEFIGYKALVNRIFLTKSRININRMTSDEIQKNIDDGIIEINQPMLAKFTNSLVICDEIHNVYNSMERNNWGSAIQYILNTVKSVRAVFMSATPINNSPTEIVDLLNLLLTDKQVVKSDFFQDGVLKKGALAHIKKLCAGKVSFLMDSNPLYFPSKRMLGVSLPGIKYLKFVRCPMSTLHHATYKSVFKDTLPQDSTHLADIVFPDPDEENIGAYRTSTIRSIASASVLWKSKNKIDFRDNHPFGEFASLENLGKYSTKYHTMVKDLHALGNKGKVFIYHNLVQVSGILLIEEILIRNGFIGEFAVSSKSTRCTVCGRTQEEHAKTQQVSGGSSQIQIGKIVVTKQGKNAREIRVSGSNLTAPPLVRYSDEKDGFYIYPGGIDVYESSTPNYIKFAKALDHLKDIAIKSRKPIIVDVLLTSKVLHKLLITLGFRIWKQDSRTLQFIWRSQEDLKINGGARYKKRRKKQTNSGKNDHEFMPARYIIAHSDIDKSKMYHSMEKFNSPENTMGNVYKIIIGSRMIKESYNFKAVQHMFVMSRPDNIPMLKQIIGRTVRKDSHSLLPPDMRMVNVSLYTSSLPSGKLSYEEIKYGEKIKSYLVVQMIETLFHENAVDASMNREVIQASVKNDSFKNFAMLDFKPDMIKPQRLKLSTFNAFHAAREVEIATIVIKRLFIETSPVWKYKDLIKAVRNPPFDVEMNPTFISDQSFNIALTNLLGADKYHIDPLIEIGVQPDVIDALYDSHDRIIHLPTGQTATISHVGEFYILGGDTVESCYRMDTRTDVSRINVRRFLEDVSSLFSYDEKKSRFYVKWSGASLSDMEPSICDFGTSFHIKFIEDCIEYVFRVWTDPSIKKSPMHTFMFKMLQFYSIRELVAWQYSTKEFIANIYTKFVTPASEEIIQTHKNQVKDIGNNKLSTSGIVNLLKSSVNNSILAWCPSELEARFKTHLNKSLDLFEQRRRNRGKLKRVPANFLPIGHFLDKVPKFYHPKKKWYASPEYTESSTKYRENDIIIGMDVRSKSSVNTRFKLRLPKHIAEKFKDKRKVLKGSVCSSSQSKGYLVNIAKKIGVEVPSKVNVTSLCSDIRSRLIYLDLKERLAKTDIKWFWFQYESGGAV